MFSWMSLSIFHLKNNPHNKALAFLKKKKKKSKDFNKEGGGAKMAFLFRKVVLATV